ncbi:porin [Oxalobacteraceae bacterium OM1]|nr:porin [Oxalobacteraceae bacterium OM1]
MRGLVRVRRCIGAGRFCNMVATPQQRVRRNHVASKLESQYSCGFRRLLPDSEYGISFCALLLVVAVHHHAFTDGNSPCRQSCNPFHHLWNDHMNNKLQSLAALALMAGTAGSALAATGVNVYGVVDVGIVRKDDANPAGKTLSLESGLQSGSRIGFRGEEDLGDGLSAIFTLENGFNADTGTLGQGGRLFGRQSWVGLKGNFGTVRAGRQQTPLYYALQAVDPFAISSEGNSQKIFGYGTYALDPLSRTDNTISYTSPVYGPVTATVFYGFGEKAGDTSASSNRSVAASYIEGPLNAQFVYHKANTLTGPAALGAVVGDTRAVFLGATYDFGIVKAHAAYADNKIDATGGSVKDRNYMLGVSAPVGQAGTILASWVRNDVQDLNDAAANQYTIGYNYALSKRTNFYSKYWYVKNDANSALATFNGTRNGENANAFSVGVRHQF